MRIECADAETAAKVHEIIANDMADHLLASGVDLDDSDAVRKALSARFGTPSIENLTGRAVGRARGLRAGGATG
ncbi:hypothetical protein [Amorphus sp. 3PC139-8]|uniref:hypothetical protein n=1 Tax=Amorphus sp. 3PC139-8 TaxID=2735676 RepID=UPI00345DEC78